MVRGLKARAHNHHHESLTSYLFGSHSISPSISLPDNHAAELVRLQYGEIGSKIENEHLHANLVKRMESLGFSRDSCSVSAIEELWFILFYPSGPALRRFLGDGAVASR